MSTAAVTFADGTVGEAMSAGVILCSPGTSLRTVARMMSTYGIHCVVVFGPGEDPSAERIWGIVSDLDLIEAVAHGGLDDRTAGSFAHTPVLTLCPSDSLGGAVQLMAESGTTHLVVTDAAGAQPIGVLSTIDIARVVAAERARGGVAASRKELR